MKKITYFIVGIFFFVISGSAFSGAQAFHNVITDHAQLFESFPESGWLILLGSLLIFSATILRRRRAARAAR